MNRHEIAALLAHIDRLAPERAPQEQAAALERVTQWSLLLGHVPAQAPHPDGRHWDAAHVAARHIATSPYPIKPSDIGAPWERFRSDLIGRHAGTFEPGLHPEIDPDDDTGNAYVAALRAERHAIAAGRALPTTHRALTAGPAAAEVERRLAELGSYIPRAVDDVLAAHRPQRAARIAAARNNQPDPLTVTCTWCGALPGQPCQTRSIRPGKDPQQRRTARATAHPSRIDAAQAAEASA